MDFIEKLMFANAAIFTAFLWFMFAVALSNGDTLAAWCVAIPGTLGLFASGYIAFGR